jgi:hypothetical protein
MSGTVPLKSPSEQQQEKKKDSNQFVISINKINNEARINNQVCIVFRFFLMF